MTSYQKLLNLFQKSRYAPIEYRIPCTGEIIRLEPVREDMSRLSCEADVSWILTEGSRYPWLDSYTVKELGDKLDRYHDIIAGQRRDALQLAYDVARYGENTELYSDLFKNIFGRRPSAANADHVLQALAELEAKAPLAR